MGRGNPWGKAGSGNELGDKQWYLRVLANLAIATVCKDMGDGCQNLRHKARDDISNQ